MSTDSYILTYLEQMIVLGRVVGPWRHLLAFARIILSVVCGQHVMLLVSHRGRNICPLTATAAPITALQATSSLPVMASLHEVHDIGTGQFVPPAGRCCYWIEFLSQNREHPGNIQIDYREWEYRDHVTCPSSSDRAQPSILPGPPPLGCTKFNEKKIADVLYVCKPIGNIAKLLRKIKK
ncbi:hypothetical protein X777_01271 [Ooceraea biroi]|uniref:Uncharacterized protein n=1 Tax=Ooceraea biroi TaxID=2015173 RepID=A0A026WT81_OOCBI|nr:hypothetical protein X777_01271 [Ooceraea biroi]